MLLEIWTSRFSLSYFFIFYCNNENCRNVKPSQYRLLIGSLMLMLKILDFEMCLNKFSFLQLYLSNCGLVKFIAGGW